MKKNCILKSVRSVEIVCRLTTKDGEMLFDLERAKRVLQQKQNVIERYCFVIHDRDVYDEDSETYKQGDLKPAHIHLLLKFKKNQPQKLGYVAQWFGIPGNFLNMHFKSWDAACAYLVHANAPEKFQYDAADVTANFDYFGFIAAYTAKREAAESEKDSASQKNHEKAMLDAIIQRILDGEIREYNKTLEIDQMFLVKHLSIIEKAFKIRADHLMATKKERNMICIYITGASGTGKTTLAKKIAENQGLAYFISSASNDVLDGYQQQPCIIVDDIRPENWELSDLLKMLDPHTPSSAKSRYRNKFLDCDLIILTCVHSLDAFYEKTRKELNEPIVQLQRRCQTYINIDVQDIRVAHWNNQKADYLLSEVYKNHLLDKYIPAEELPPEDTLSRLNQLLPFLQPDSDSADESTHN